MREIPSDSPAPTVANSTEGSNPSLTALAKSDKSDKSQTRTLRVLVFGEFSGRIREAFRSRGHDAWSCDLEESEIPGNHIIGDGRSHLNEGWDILIGHPYCTFTAVSGARWFAARLDEQEKAVGFFIRLWNAPVPKIALEHPISIISTWFRQPDQIIQPWQFGHGETKATCLWLKNLPPLRPTNIVPGRTDRVHREPPGPDRWKNRSRTYTGIARAMAEQWGQPDQPELWDKTYTKETQHAGVAAP